jgi:NDP-sugar pyrophosphorylase family protein
MNRLGLDNTSPLGMAGAVRLALPLLTSDSVLVMNGDSLCQTRLDNFWASHSTRGANSTLLLTQVSDTSRYGRVHADAEGRVIRFEEKNGKGGPGWINAGAYLLKRRLLEMIPASGAVSLWNGRCSLPGSVEGSTATKVRGAFWLISNERQAGGVPLWASFRSPNSNS